MSTKLFSRLTRLARSFILLRSGNWKDCGGRKRANSTTDATRYYRQCGITVSTTANSVQSGLPHSWRRPWLKHCRTGQVAGAFLEKEGIPFLGLELDPGIVKEARLAGQPVFCADSSDQSVLENAGLEGADMLVVTHSDISSALQTLRIVKSIRPDLKTIVQTTNDRLANQLRDAGATEVIPEALETGLLIASHLLLTLKVPGRKVARYLLISGENATRCSGKFSAVTWTPCSTPISMSKYFTQYEYSMEIPQQVRLLRRLWANSNKFSHRRWYGMVCG